MTRRALTCSSALMRSGEFGQVVRVSKLSQKPKRIGGSIWRKLSRKAKLLVPVAVLGALVWIVGDLVAEFLN